ncbi:hypothetical protein [Clostridium akagii]|uniref:hypothetical protein n=1 Tax=Clostridium akagii TaxID=91623 RepID=UPI00047C4DE5|nr:hypothetical protein [Clostridium akagii]
MISAPSRYAHLPTKEEDYKYIIDKIDNGMFVENVDDIIAESKSRKTVKHNYRTNLKNLGLFTYSILNGKKIIELNNNVYLYKKNIISLRELLKVIIENNKELMDIKQLSEKNGIFDFKLESIAILLNSQFPNRGYDNILRWFRPVVFLLVYVYLDDKAFVNDIYLKSLEAIQNEYFNIASDYGEPVAIEEIELKIMKKYPKLNVIDMWNKVYSDENLEYKLSFITFPSWFTEHKHLIINGKVFTHIRIKKNII